MHQNLCVKTHTPNAHATILMQQQLVPMIDEPQPAWSILTTLFWAATLIVVPGVIVGYAFSIYANVTEIVDTTQWFAQIEVLMVMTFVIYFFTLSMIIGLAKFSAHNQSTFNYLNIKSAHKNQVLQVVVISAIFWGVLTVSGILLNLPEEPFMLQLKHSNMPIWFVFLNVCLLAPIVEEVACRGFLFKRFQLTKLGVSGAVIVTSLLFTSLHGQYGMIGLAIVLVMALYFSWLRVRTQNTTLCIIGHSTCNTLTMIALYSVN